MGIIDQPGPFGNVPRPHTMEQDSRFTRDRAPQQSSDGEGSEESQRSTTAAVGHIATSDLPVIPGGGEYGNLLSDNGSLGAVVESGTVAAKKE